MHDPDVEPMLVVLTGATDLRKVFSAEEMPGIIRSYMGGLKNAFIIGIVVAGMMFVVSFGNKWHNLKEVNAAKTNIEQPESAEKGV